ncbi:30S ribosomal protein S17 [Candidatus Woesearchaeota archaeon]|nr:30S ribosomal protein S17 [Candidatus Woesearchaeota archaeon]MBW3006065.1 30S ribosomal protein S17 [Candidatus Woesearchaeota archaeon]
MKTEAKDNKQPGFDSLSLRGRTFRGVVINDVMQKTVTVEWERRKHNTKYERYEKKRTRVKAHNPEKINAKKGDLVEIRECRPLSKTKNFVVIKKLGEERLFKEREKSLEESKVKQKKAEEPVEEKPAEVPAEEPEKIEEVPEKEKVEEAKDEGS